MPIPGLSDIYELSDYLKREYVGGKRKQMLHEVWYTNVFSQPSETFANRDDATRYAEIFCNVKKDK